MENISKKYFNGKKWSLQSLRICFGVPCAWKLYWRKYIPHIKGWVSNCRSPVIIKVFIKKFKTELQNTYKAVTNPKGTWHSQYLRFWLLSQFCDLHAKEPWHCVGIWSSKVSDGPDLEPPIPTFLQSLTRKICRAVDWSRRGGQEREEQGTGESLSVLKAH